MKRATNAENTPAAPPDFAGVIAAVETLAKRIESPVTCRFTKKPLMLTKDWSNKLDKFITALETAQSPESGAYRQQHS